MKVAILDNSVSTTGALLSAVAVVDALREDGEFELILPAGYGGCASVERSGVRVRTLPMLEIGRSVSRLALYVPMLLVNARHLARLLREQGFDILLANDYYNLLPTIVRWFGWRGRTITIIRLLPASQPRLLNTLWLRATRLASDQVVAVSRVVADQAAPVLRADALYFPVGKQFMAGKAHGQSSQSGHGGTVRFLYLANFIRGKGQADALMALAMLKNKHGPIRLTLAGGDMGLKKNERYRAELEHIAAELGISDQVEFIGQVADQAPLYAQSDVVLNFSNAESFSQTCAEAGLMQRPVIATRCGGPEEIIADGLTGLLVDRGDVPAMAAAMARLIDDASLRLAMGLEARKRLEKMLDGAVFRARFLPMLGKRP